jgi:hypothetical protein
VRVKGSVERGRIEIEYLAPRTSTGSPDGCSAMAEPELRSRSAEMAFEACRAAEAARIDGRSPAP